MPVKCVYDLAIMECKGETLSNMLSTAAAMAFSFWRRYQDLLIFQEVLNVAMVLGLPHLALYRGNYKETFSRRMSHCLVRNDSVPLEYRSRI